MDDSIVVDEVNFCCHGCKTIYQVLKTNDLIDYYAFDTSPGTSQKAKINGDFDFLDDVYIQQQLISFKDEQCAIVTLQIPQIHCSSCLWLLENIVQLDPAINSSRVNFVKQEATIKFSHKEISLKGLVEILSRIGYEPEFTLADLDTSVAQNSYNKTLLYQLGLAGFAFGNIMLLSFPEYLGYTKAFVRMSVGYINILLAIPVLLYSCKDYIKSAFVGIRQGHLNIDVPIVIGMITLFSRSVYEILSQTGEGYLDSFSGFIFFLLIGKWFQSFTYKALDYDRTYKSYFPISAIIKKGEKWVSKSIDRIAKGDILLIRHQQIVPVDGVLTKGKGRLDYSFVTGESDNVSKEIGDKIYAGGKQMGTSIELIVKEVVNESYLTQLWNEDTFKKNQNSSSSRLITTISKYFTQVILLIAVFTLGFWLLYDVDSAFRVFTAVLIVACPCALALSIPFTYGYLLRILSTKGLYLRNVETIENIQDIDHIIFDKTGTITDSTRLQLDFVGKPLSPAHSAFVKSSCLHSSHPLSKAIVDYLDDTPTIEIDDYKDVIGSGLIAKYAQSTVRIGSEAFIFGTDPKDSKRGVFIEIDCTYMGHFTFKDSLRSGVRTIIQGLKCDFSISLLSGDNDNEAQRVYDLFGTEQSIYFNQSPKDKLTYIKKLQADGERVMMIGDGLNDAGALRQSNVGIVVSDHSNNFSPSCDGIILASSFIHLLRMIVTVRSAKWIVYGAFILAFCYNMIGLYFAVSGQLSPIIAAILMPLSSVTVIVYGILGSIAISKSTFSIIKN